MSNLSTLPKGDSAWLLRKAIERIMEQVSVLETNIGSSTTGNSANTQIIFNDNGTLRGDAGLVYNKTTDALTVAGLVTAGSATITGDLTVDTSTLKVDSTNNRVGVGTASPGAELEVYKNTNGLNRVFVNNPSTGASAYSSIDLTTGTTGGKILQLGSGYSGSYPYITGSTVIQNDSVGGVTLHSVGPYPIYFGTNNIERLRINSSGNLVFAGGTAGANGIGVTFPATQVASSDANCLDDYEEGTFTPTMTASAGTLTTTTVNAASYTKIGRLVSVQVDISIVNIGTASGQLFFSLPFSQGTDTNVGVLRELGATGNNGQISYQSATTAYACFFGNGTLVVNGYRIRGTYTYTV